MMPHTTAYHSNISKYFLRDYGTIAMVIILVTMVTITTVISSRVKIYMLFAGWEVRIVKNCDRDLEVLHFQDRGHSFSLFGPT